MTSSLRRKLFRVFNQEKSQTRKITLFPIFSSIVEARSQKGFISPFFLSSTLLFFSLFLESSFFLSFSLSFLLSLKQELIPLLFLQLKGLNFFVGYFIQGLSKKSRMGLRSGNFIFFSFFFFFLFSFFFSFFFFLFSFFFFSFLLFFLFFFSFFFPFSQISFDLRAKVSFLLLSLSSP